MAQMHMHMRFCAISREPYIPQRALDQPAMAAVISSDDSPLPNRHRVSGESLTLSPPETPSAARQRQHAGVICRHLPHPHCTWEVLQVTFTQ